MSFLEPVWLLLAVPLGLALAIFRPRAGWLLGLRIALFALLVLALARPALEIPGRAGTLVVVADRSASMPPGSDAAQQEILDLLQASMPAADRLAVVSFAETAAVEHAPQGGRFAGFTAAVGSEQSSLADALDRALALVPGGGAGRVLLLTDGRWTGRDPAAVAGRAAAAGVPVDFRLQERVAARDLALDRVDAPQEVSPGEAYLLTAWVRSPVSQEVDFELRRGETVLAAGSREVPAGLSRLTFRDRAAGPGTSAYTLSVAAAAEDPVPENNRSRLLVGVRGPRPVLVVHPGGETGFGRLLRRGSLEIREAAPHTVSWSLAELSRYSAVVLEDLPAGEVGPEGMEILAAWVEASGGGLMMTGGEDSFGPGGYFRSPLEAVLPVSMELRREHRKLALAIVVALDRSGSMAATVADGRTKMDLANLASVEVLGLLSPMDEFGLVAVDSMAHVISPLRSVEDLASSREALLRVDSQGGGIFVYEALEAAAEQLLKARSGTRHILLFADAADAENPGEYRALLARCRAADITVSVVGLGSPGDADAEFLRDVARRGGGQIYFTDSPFELPRIFAQDTFIVARSSFLEEVTPMRATGGLAALTGRAPAGSLPALGGYNLTYLRQGANLAVVTEDDYEAPVVASWQVGLGRVLAFTGEADGELTGPLATWPGTGDLLTGLVRWTAGAEGDLPGGMLVRQSLEGGLAKVSLDLDPERGGEAFTTPPRVAVVRARPGREPEVESAPLRWTGADRLEAEVPLSGDEVMLATVDVPGAGTRQLAPVRLPYSPEHQPAEGGGLAALDRLARSTGGEQRVDLTGVWNAFPRQPRLVELAAILVLLAALVLLAEVLERRTGLLSLARVPRPALPRRERRPLAKSTAPRPAPASSSTQQPAGVPAEPKEEAPQPEPPLEVPGVLDALGKARQRARDRVGR